MRTVLLTFILGLSACSFEPGIPPSAGDTTPDDAGNSSTPDVGADGDAADRCPVDGDSDGYGIGPDCPPEQRDCDDTRDDRNPDAPELCNGVDDNCDGVVDDGCDCVDGQSRACGSDVGACQAGTQTCADGEFGPCTGAVEPIDETCNQIDDNCDGTADEGCSCTTGDVRPCGESTGACVQGSQTCIDGMWGDCTGATGPQAEICNDIDDNCDGMVDNDVTDLGGACSTGLPGVCADGIEVCRDGAATCENVTAAQPEACNGIDDDCDGNTDEDVTQACNSACGPGTQACNMGTFGDCQATSPPQEVCDGSDNDCDGQVDESFPEAGQTCDTGALGPCGEGTSTCQQGALKCEAAVGPSPEICDGEDNDCDGDTDEDSDGLILTEDCGACPSGTRVCQSGAWSTCSINNFEVCNGSDSNCDGAVDNDTACLIACGDRSAVGTLSCGPTATCTPPQEICGDGVDNDCDGTVDQTCGNGLTDMVFVPAGRFVMGSDPMADPNAQADEQPMRTVAHSPFYIDRTEVSRAEYARCVAFGGCSLLQQGCPLQLTNQQGPIGCVTWNQANNYCSWVGKRLPTEAEWERAARGGWDRDVIYPWGDVAIAVNAVFNCGSGLVQCTASVDSFPQGASADGLLHMSGNVAEWVSDFYDPNYYSSNPQNPDPEQTTDLGFGHVVRGGSYAQAINFGRVANRAQPSFFTSAEEIGFRCARDAP